jgi:hypothetical protein
LEHRVILATIGNCAQRNFVAQASCLCGGLSAC